MKLAVLVPNSSFGSMPGTTVHARLVAAVSIVMWTAAIAWTIYVMDEAWFLLQVQYGSPQQAAVAGMECIKIIGAYALARGVQEIGELSLRLFAKKAGSAGQP